MTEATTGDLTIMMILFLIFFIILNIIIVTVLKLISQLLRYISLNKKNRNYKHNHSSSKAL